jgi:hypothetical protein
LNEAADKVASKETTGQPESASSSTSAATATAASSSIEGLTFNVEHSFSGDADKQTWSSRGKYEIVIEISSTSEPFNFFIGFDLMTLCLHVYFTLTS